MTTLRSLSLVALLAMASFVALPAHAEPTQAQKDIARDALILGRKKLDAGQFDEARELFSKAHDIMHVATTALDLMKAYGALDQLVEAWAIGEEMQKTPAKPEDPAAYAEARQQIDEAMEALATRIPTIRLKISGTAPSEIRATLDGVPVQAEQFDNPIRVNPGDRKIEVTARYCGTFAATQRTEAGLNRHYDVEVKLDCHPPAPPPKAVPPPPPPKKAQDATVATAWIATGVLAGVTAGTGIAAIKTYDTMEDAWYGRGCGTNCRSQYESRRPQLQGLSTTAVVAGVLGAGALGYALYATLTRPKAPVSAQFVPTPQGAMIVGTW